MKCVGTDTNHCCWFQGRQCEFLVEYVAGRRWACSLRVELGSWDAVHADPRYQPVKRRVLALSTAPALCGDWPPAGKLCNACKKVGD